MALDKFNAPVLPNPPPDYDSVYMRQLIRSVEIYHQQLDSPTPNNSEKYTASYFVGGALNLSTTQTSANYTAQATDFLINVDATAGNRVVTLPPATSSAGRIIVVKKIDTSGNSVTVDGDGSDTINNAANVSTSTAYVSFMVQCDAAEWWTI